MNGIYRLLIILAILFSQNTYAGAPGKKVFYLSLSGNDAWSGSLSDANSTQTDGPLRSFEKAKQKMEEWIRQNNSPESNVEIIIRGGAYTFNETLLLKGYVNTKVNIIWKNYPGEKVQLVGGKEIKGFHAVTDAVALSRINTLYTKKIVELDLKAIGITDFGVITNRGKPGMELFFDNKKMPLSRWPNQGWAKIADVPQTGELVNKGELPHMRFGIPVGRHYGRFTYDGDRQSHWSNISSISLHGYWTWDWFDEYLCIQSIDTVTKEIFIKPPHSQYGLCKEQRYYALNILEELDEPGEWYIDRERGKLFFWPPASLESGRTFASMLNQPLIQLQEAENIHIEGLFIEFSRGGGIVINDGKNNLVAGCTFDNLGEAAVNINGGVYNGVSSCDIHDMAGEAIILNGGNRKTLTRGNNFAVNNHIHHFGEWIRTYQAAVRISGVGNRIAHNLIHNAPGLGIALTGNEHVIEYNEMFDLALETGDVGAFYMGRDWTERGTIIRYNYFHDLTGSGTHDVNAVYLDDWASATTVQGNIFSHCARGIMIGGGRDNLVDNNIFIDCNINMHVDSRGLGWAKYYFDGSDNTLFKRMDAMNYKQSPYAEKYPILLSLYNDEPAVAKNNSIVHNITYKGKWLDLYDGLDLTIVHAENNLVADVSQTQDNDKDIIVKNNPGLYNIKKHDFRVKSKAMKYGFKPIPYSEIGLQRDSFRLNPVKTFSYR
jgi:parallel beta-helix repeat protein